VVARCGSLLFCVSVIYGLTGRPVSGHRGPRSSPFRHPHRLGAGAKCADGVRNDHPGQGSPSRGEGRARRGLCACSDPPFIGEGVLLHQSVLIPSLKNTLRRSNSIRSGQTKFESTGRTNRAGGRRFRMPPRLSSSSTNNYLHTVTTWNRKKKWLP
jgi:hypothetical protein